MVFICAVLGTVIAMFYSDVFVKVDYFVRIVFIFHAAYFQRLVVF